jgi:AbiV family abortive infection protein
MGRAYSLAVLAVEECGKAADLTALAVIPKSIRAQAPVGRMPEWHQMKLVGGLLLAVLPFGRVASRVGVMPTAELAHRMRILYEPADEADRLKRRGFYVDMDRSGRIRAPSEVTEAEVASQLGRARQAAASIGPLLAPDAQARIANPPADGVKLAREMVTAAGAAGHSRTPKAAADVMLRAVSEFREDATTR